MNVNEKWDEFSSWLNDNNFELYDGLQDLRDIFLDISSSESTPDEKSEQIASYMENKWGLYDGYNDVIEYLEELLNDESIVESKSHIMKFGEFLNESKTKKEPKKEKEKEKEEPKDKGDYKKWQNFLLKKYDVKSPFSISDKSERKKFYTELKKGWDKGEGLSEYGKKLMSK